MIRLCQAIIVGHVVQQLCCREPRCENVSDERPLRDIVEVALSWIAVAERDFHPVRNTLVRNTDVLDMYMELIGRYTCTQYICIAPFC